MRRLAPWATLAFALAACRGPSTPTPPATPPPLADVIEAIFLGSGPLAAGDCITPSILATPLRNTTFTVVIGTTIDAAGERTIEEAITDVQQVNNGRFRIVVERSGAADPLPGPLQITSADVPDATIQMLCSPGGSGCTRGLTFNGASITSARWRAANRYVAEAQSPRVRPRDRPLPRRSRPHARRSHGAVARHDGPGSIQRAGARRHSGRLCFGARSGRDTRRLRTSRLAVMAAMRIAFPAG
jgi:hypothetical protein